MEEILTANGLVRDQLYTSLEQITHVEMFLHFYPKVDAMRGPWQGLEGRSACKRSQTLRMPCPSHDLLALLLCRYADVGAPVLPIPQDAVPHTPGTASMQQEAGGREQEPARWCSRCASSVLPHSADVGASGLGSRADTAGTHTPVTSQEIKEIANLDECVNLEKLWIIENDVKQIKGLDKLRNLRELYLYR